MQSGDEGARPAVTGTGTSGVYFHSPGGARSARRPDFELVARAARRDALAVLRRLLPSGRLHASEWVAGNPTRADRRPGSFRVNTQTGRWADFATGDRGGDLVSLVAYLERCSQGDAARLLAGMLGVMTPVSAEAGNGHDDAAWKGDVRDAVARLAQLSITDFELCLVDEALALVGPGRDQQDVAAPHGLRPA